MPTYIGALPDRLRGRNRRRRQTTDILFIVCDHFEPRHDALVDSQPTTRVKLWREGYAALQARCRASFGHAPVHTWFYPPHHGSEHLPALAEYQFCQLGEVELHYHHDGDTSQSLRRNLQTALAEYNSWGLLLESGPQPRTSFGFIHGDWALDNSCDGKYCGVNDELTILQELGCWGDLTMPSANKCQTRKINSIYYAIDDPTKPKSHDWGVDAAVGKIDPKGLFLMQGPLGINWHAPKYPRIENGSLTTENWGRPDRIEKWLDCNVHVRGRPEWVFVKLHTHGAIERDFDALFGERAFQMHRILNERYNDGSRYRLHYVTAREAYNIAKAAENGCSGDPSAYRNLRLAPNATRFYLADAPHRLLHCTSDRVALEYATPSLETRLRLSHSVVRDVRGQMASLDADEATGRLRLSGCLSGTRVSVSLNSQAAASASVAGARCIGREHEDGVTVLSLLADEPEVLVDYNHAQPS